MPKHVLQMLEAGALTEADRLYVAQGSGLDCDRKVTLALLRSFIVAAAAIIDTANIVNGAVTGEKLATDSVTGDKIAAGAVGNSELASESVTGDKIAAGAVGNSELANLSVTTAKLANNDVTSEKLAPGAVGTMAIDTGAVTSAKLADEAVTSAKLDDGALQITTVAAGSSRTPMFERILGLLQLKHFIIQSWHIADYAIKSANLGSNSVTEEKWSNALQEWKTNISSQVIALLNAPATTFEVVPLGLTYQSNDVNPTSGGVSWALFGSPLPINYAAGTVTMNPAPVAIGGETVKVRGLLTIKNTDAAFTARVILYVYSAAIPNRSTATKYYSQGFTVPRSADWLSIGLDLSFTNGGTITTSQYVEASLEFTSNTTTTFSICKGNLRIQLRGEG